MGDEPAAQRCARRTRRGGEPHNEPCGRPDGPDGPDGRLQGHRKGPTARAQSATRLVPRALRPLGSQPRWPRLGCVSTWHTALVGYGGRRRGHTSAGTFDWLGEGYACMSAHLAWKSTAGSLIYVRPDQSPYVIARAR